MDLIAPIKAELGQRKAAILKSPRSRAPRTGAARKAQLKELEDVEGGLASA